jgi:hypothetical protein
VQIGEHSFDTPVHGQLLIDMVDVGFDLSTETRHRSAISYCHDRPQRRRGSPLLLREAGQKSCSPPRASVTAATARRANRSA